MGPTGGETVRYVPKSPAFDTRRWFVDVDGDGVQDKLYCTPAQGGAELKLKLADAVGAPVGSHPVVPVDTGSTQPTTSIAPIFPKLCSCTDTFCTNPTLPTMLYDIDGDGTRNLIVHDDSQAGGQWSALVFRNGALAWDSSFFSAISGLISYATHRILPADVNGDGLRDLVAFAAKREEWDLGAANFDPLDPNFLVDVTPPSYAALNTGSGFEIRTLVSSPGEREAILAPARTIFIVDYDGDGNEEFLEPGPDPTILTTPCSNFGGSSSCRLSSRPWLVREIDIERSVADHYQAGLDARPGSTGDFDGDGNLDVLTFGNDSSHLILHRGKGRKHGLLQSVTDGLGRRIQIQYDIKDQGERVFDSGAPTPDPVDPACRWPYRCSERAPHTLVSSHSEGHFRDAARTEANFKLEHVTRYRYKGSRSDIAGHGWLGFWEREIRREDSLGPLIGKTLIRFQAPEPWNPSTSSTPYVHALAGLTKEVVATSPLTVNPFGGQSEVFVQETTFDWVTGTSADGRSYPKLATRMETLRGIANGAAPGEALARRTTTFLTDDHGNVHYEHLDADDLASDGSPVPGSRTMLQVDRVYNPGLRRADWLVGLMDEETVTSTPRCSSGTDCLEKRRQRRTRYDYYPNGTPSQPNGMLPQFVTRQPGDPTQELKTEYQWTPQGNLEREIAIDLDGNRRETETTYDNRQLFAETVTRIGESQRHTTQVRHDDRFGTLVINADPNGIDSTWSYDELGIERHHRGPEGERFTSYLRTDRFIDTVVTNQYIESAYRFSVSNIDGPVVETDYNPLGQVVRRMKTGYLGDGVFEEFLYDHRQRLYQKSLPHVATSSQSVINYNYDGQDRLSVVTYPNGSNVQYQRGLLRFAGGPPDWNAPGALFVERTRLAHAPGQNIDSYELDDRDGATVRSIDGLGGFTDYTHAAFGAVGQITDPALRTIAHLYDDWGRRVQVTDPARGGTEQSTYNGFGLVARTEDVSQRVRRFTYDDFGRPELVEDSIANQAPPNPPVETRWYYDGDGMRSNELGRLVETLSSSGQRSVLRYEPPEATRNRGLVRQATEHRVAPGNSATTRAFVTDYQYDNAARVVRIDYPDAFGTRHGVIQQYDTYGHLVAVRDANDSTLTYWQLVEADQGHRVKCERVGTAACGAGTAGTSCIGGTSGGTLTERSFDPESGKLESIKTVCNGTELQSLSYAYDGAGRMSYRGDGITGRQELFRYDDLGRVTHINEVEHAAYDPEGRGRLTRLRSNAGVRDHAYSSQGRDWILSATGTGAADPSYTPDLVGNVQTRTIGSTTQTFDYTHFDLPKSITTGSQVTRFGYDVFGERSVKESPTSTTFYAGKHHQQVEPQLGGSEARSYVYAGGRPVAQLATDSSGTTARRYLYDDVLGSVAVVTGSNGVVESARDYAPFGEQRNPAAAMGQVTYGFTGHEQDEDLGIINMRGRLYDPAIGQFLQADPMLTNPASQGLNRYAYVNNSPLNATDPTGKFAVGLLGQLALGSGMLVAGRELDLDPLIDPFRKEPLKALGALGEAWLLSFTGSALARTYGGSHFMSAEARAQHGWINGWLAGSRGSYSLNLEGAAWFVSDSTWAIGGTALGNFINLGNSVTGVHYINTLSKRQNRQVFWGGFGFGRYAHTQGNVISNFGSRSRGLLNHETEHVTANRVFGPLYTWSYAAWFSLMAYYSTVFTVGDLDYWQNLSTSNAFDHVYAYSYYSNPWEGHAYCEHNPGAWKGENGAFNLACH